MTTSKAVGSIVVGSLACSVWMLAKTWRPSSGRLPADVQLAETAIAQRFPEGPS